ncbi:MAG: hypothetical protein M3M85_00690 [bacterium]|nr:hypothetical protein [bacterium]
MKENLYIPEPRTHLDTSIVGNKPIYASVMGKFTDSASSPEFTKLKKEVEAQEETQRREKRGWYQKDLNTAELAIGEGPKRSHGYMMCTGLVVVGIDRETGKNVSFISHQTPAEILDDEMVSFKELLKERLAEMEARCLPGTVDAVIVGGYDRKKVTREAKEYEKILSYLGSEVKKYFKFDPTVVNGPQFDGGMSDIWFDTENRRLYYVRHKVNDMADFPTADYKEAKRELPEQAARKKKFRKAA